jgi:hypothetical protein
MVAPGIALCVNHVVEEYLSQLTAGNHIWLIDALHLRPTDT